MAAAIAASAAAKHQAMLDRIATGRKRCPRCKRVKRLARFGPLLPSGKVRGWCLKCYAADARKRRALAKLTPAEREILRARRAASRHAKLWAERQAAGPPKACPVDGRPMGHMRPHAQVCSPRCRKVLSRSRQKRDPGQVVAYLRCCDGTFETTTGWWYARHRPGCLDARWQPSFGAGCRPAAEDE